MFFQDGNNANEFKQRVEASLNFESLQSSIKITEKKLLFATKKHPFVIGTSLNKDSKVFISRYNLSRCFKKEGRTYLVYGNQVNKIVYSWLLRLPYSRGSPKINKLHGVLENKIADFLNSNSYGFHGKHKSGLNVNISAQLAYIILIKSLSKEKEYESNCKVLEVLLTEVFTDYYSYKPADYILLSQFVINSVLQEKDSVINSYRTYLMSTQVEIIEPSAPPLEEIESEESSRGEQDYSCKICFDNAPNLVFDSCKHIVCENCYIVGKMVYCPMCKSPITTVTRIFNS